MATILSIAQEKAQISSFTEIADAVAELENLNEKISLLISNPASGVSDLDAVIAALADIEVTAENVNLNTDTVEAKLDTLDTSIEALTTALAGADTSDSIGDLRVALAGSTTTDKIGDLQTALVGSDTSDKIGDFQAALAGTSSPNDRLGDIITQLTTSIGDGTYGFETLQAALAGTSSPSDRIGDVATSVDNLKTALAGTETSDKIGDLQAALAGTSSPSDRIGNVATSVDNLKTALAGSDTSDKLGDVETSITTAIGTSNGHLTNVVSDIDDMNGYMAAQSAFSTGSKGNVNQTASQLNSSSTVSKKGVFIMADSSNSGKIYFGGANTVTAGTNSSTDGIPLSGGDNAFIPVDNVNKVYLITGESSNQSVFWMSI